MKPSQNGVDEESVCDKAQLPDITSVHSYSEPEEEIKTVDEFDLIKQHSVVESLDSDSSEDLPPIVCIDTVVNASLPDLHVTPLTFDSVEVPDSDLVSYLDSLDRDSCAINSISDNISECIDSVTQNVKENVDVSSPKVVGKVTEPEPSENLNQSSASVPQSNICVSEITDEHSSEEPEQSVVSQAADLPRQESTDSKESYGFINDSTVVNDVTSVDDAPVSLSSDSDDKELTTLSSSLSELETKQRYSLCPDISDEFLDEPDDPLSITDISVTSEGKFTLSDVCNGNVASHSAIAPEIIETDTSVNAEQNLTQILNLNIIPKSTSDTDIKEVVCDLGRDEILLNKNIPETADDIESNRIIIKVQSEESEVVITSNDESVDPTPANNSINGSIDRTVTESVNDSLNFNADTAYNTVECLPQEIQSQQYNNSEQSIECLDNTLNSNSDAVVQNLQNSETEREEIDNRDNEEKAVLGFDLENNDASGNGSYFYQSESSCSSETNTVDSDMKPSRPSTLPLPHSHIVTDSEESPTPSNSSSEFIMLNRLYFSAIQIRSQTNLIPVLINLKR